MDCCKLYTFPWDQSDNYVKLYLTVPDVHTLTEDGIAISFADSAVEVVAYNVHSKNYSLIIKGLLHPIEPTQSFFKQKVDLLLVMMKKKELKKWDYLTKAEKQSKEKSKPSLDEKADPQESLMNLMKQMYDEGDDEMKRTIRKAWYESQTKKNADLNEHT
ncbi:unnamed protein product [Gongylonema pulchrum]|uniref:Calcyclin-binding protein n=1 Tax=Gongylonema pulchrum TaxID=637853 RepID=A0A183DXH6_9BILA|nr:unnamed protein product [Gongylonema pulchrum]